MDVKVVAPAGTSAVTAGDRFTYGNFPVVTGVSPAQALAGNVVTITGSNFTGATADDFGWLAATGFTVSSNGSSIAATRPAALSGTVNVTVTTPTGTSAVTGGIAPAARMISSPLVGRARGHVDNPEHGWRRGRHDRHDHR